MANPPKFEISSGSEFSLANLPFGVFSHDGYPHRQPRCCSRVGDYIVDLAAAAIANIILIDPEVVSQPSLNAFAALGPSVVRDVRSRIANAYKKPSDEALDCLYYINDCIRMHIPFSVRDYTDFLCSREHAGNMGRIMSGQERLMPGFLRHPIAYHGRASSVVVSGTSVRRPIGSTFTPPSGDFGFVPSKQMDFELEMGYFIGKPTSLGDRVSMADAPDYIFGIVLVNDWSARDHQGLEMSGLGPFNSKNFATSVSPWVVTLDALSSHNVSGPELAPNTAPHLLHGERRGRWFDVALEVAINDHVISRPNLKHMTYSPEQMVVHQSLGGAPLAIGDLLATGTCSSPQGQVGCLAEMTNGGKEAFSLGNKEQRIFLEDGDTVRFRAWAGGEQSGIGWGECVGTILPASLL